MKPANSETFWKRADTLRLVQMVMVGLAVGIMGHYLYITAPPLPVMAAGATLSANTNALPVIKTEGASPSVRD